MRYLVATILVLGLARAAEPPAGPKGPSEMDLKEAAAFIELARDALGAGKTVETVCVTAAKSLWLITEDVESGLPGLVRGLNNSSTASRSAEIMVKIGASVVPILMRALEHKHSHVRKTAAEALGEIGADAAPAVSALDRLLNNKREAEYVRQAAARALKKIRGSEGKTE